MKKRLTELNGKQERMVHVRLDEDLHRRLRVFVAARDLSIQEWVASVIAREVANEDLASTTPVGAPQP